jgi:hypothetical protein
MITKVRTTGCDKGRSAANLVLESNLKTGHLMSLPNVRDMLVRVALQKIPVVDGWFVAEFEEYNAGGYKRLRLKKDK